MTPTQRLQAFKDAVFWLEYFRNLAMMLKTEEEMTGAIEAFTPIISGKMVVVPAVPTEEMMRKMRKIEWWPNYEKGFSEPPIMRQVYNAMIEASQENL